VTVLLQLAQAATTLALACGVVLWIAAPGSPRVELILDAGLVLLMMAPVVRLIGAVIEEARAREWRFAALGVGVLVLMSVSLMIAFG
jgi:hypothetical protein